MSRRMAVAAVCAAAVLWGSCADGDRTLATPTPAPRSTPAPDPACSSARLSNELTMADVPAAVRITRQAIADAAVSCDYDKLERLAAESGRFTYSLDEPSSGEGWDPPAWWLAREAAGEPVLETMVRVLDMRAVSAEVTIGDAVVRLHVWPRAFDPGEATEPDWDDVEKVHAPDQVQRWRQANVYHGWRLGITDDGDWIYFVTGECRGATRRPVDPRACPATERRPVP